VRGLRERKSTNYEGVFRFWKKKKTDPQTEKVKKRRGRRKMESGKKIDQCLIISRQIGTVKEGPRRKRKTKGEEEDLSTEHEKGNLGVRVERSRRRKRLKREGIPIS